MAKIPLTMPKMSMTMEEGTVVEWNVAAGDTVAKGDVVAVVMTDKVDMEVESAAAGTVAELLVAEGDTLAVGAPMAMIDSEEDDLLGDLFGGGADDEGASTEGGKADRSEVSDHGEGSDPAGAPEHADTSENSATTDASESPGPRGEMPPAVPLARKLARDHGLDLRDITPTGPHGTVRVKDVKQEIDASGAERVDRDAATGSPSAAPATASADPATAPAAGAGGTLSAPVADATPEQLLGDARTRRTRQLTARAMEPTAVVPQFTAFRTLDLSATARARTGVLRGVSWTTLLVRAYAMLLRQNEQLNGYWAGTGVARNETVSVVLAVDTPGGLMVPALTDPDQIGIRDLDGQVRALAADAKDGKIDASLLRPGTGTVSNLGGMGVDRFNALITPPQATALSVGTVGFAPHVADDGTVIGRMACEVGLSIDHRAADGADAARALQTLQDLLDDPLRLAL